MKHRKRAVRKADLLQPRGVKHMSGASDDADCIFFEESDGSFDIKMVK